MVIIYYLLVLGVRSSYPFIYHLDSISQRLLVRLLNALSQRLLERRPSSLSQHLLEIVAVRCYRSSTHQHPRHALGASGHMKRMNEWNEWSE